MADPYAKYRPQSETASGGDPYAKYKPDNTDVKADPYAKYMPQTPTSTNSDPYAKYANSSVEPVKGEKAQPEQPSFMRDVVGKTATDVVFRLPRQLYGGLGEGVRSLGNAVVANKEIIKQDAIKRIDVKDDNEMRTALSLGLTDEQAKEWIGTNPLNSFDLYKWRGEQAEKGQAPAENISDAMPKMLPPDNIIEEAVGGMAAFAPTMAIGAANPWLTLPMAYEQIFGMKYSDYREQGVAEDRALDGARIVAAISAPIEAAGTVLEFAQLGRLANGILSKTGAGKSASAFMKRFLATPGIEAAEEYMQAYPELLGNIYATSPDATGEEIKDEFFRVAQTPEFQKEAARSGLVGAVGGAGMAGGATVVGKIREKLQNKPEPTVEAEAIIPETVVADEAPQEQEAAAPVDVEKVAPEASKKAPVSGKDVYSYAFDLMGTELSNSETKGVSVDKTGEARSYGASSPPWMKALHKIVKTDNARGDRDGKLFSRKEIGVLISKHNNDEPFTNRQAQRFELLKEAADKFMAEDPNMIAALDELYFESQGFEMKGDTVPAIDFKEGDRFYGKVNNRTDEYMVKGIDDAGNVIIENGNGVVDTLDSFDLIDVTARRDAGSEAPVYEMPEIITDIRLKKNNPVKYSMSKLEKLKKQIKDRDMDIKAKVDAFKEYSKTLPLHVRGKAIPNFGKMVQAKQKKTRQKYLNEALSKLEKQTVDYLKSNIKKDIHKIRKRPSLITKDRVKKTTIGAEAAESLEIINKKILNSLKTSSQKEERLATLEQRIVNLEKNREPGEAGPEFLSKLERADKEIELVKLFGGLNDMDVFELQAAKKNLTRIIQTGRTEWQEKEIARKQKLKDEAFEYAKEITGDENPVPETWEQEKNRRDEQEKSTKHYVNKKFSHYDTIHQSWPFLMDKLATKSGKKTLTSNLARTLGRQAHVAVNVENDLNSNITDIMESKLKDISGKKGWALERWVNKKSNDKVEYTIKRDGDRKPVSLSSWEAAYYWAQKQRGDTLALEGNNAFNARLKKMGLDDNFFNQIEGAVDPEILELAEWLPDNVGEAIWQAASPVFENLQGAKLTHSESYTPTRADYRAGAESTSVMEQANLISGKPGALHELSNTQMGIRPSNLLQVWVDHAYDMNHYSAWGEAIRDFDGIFKDENMKRFISQEHGDVMNADIERFIELFKQGQRKRKELVQGFDSMRAKFVTSVIGLNPLVYTKQLTSIPMMGADIPTQDFVAGMADFMLNPKKAIKTLNQSSRIKSRYEKGHTRDVAKAQLRTLGQTVAKTRNMSDLMMTPAKLGDKQAIYLGGWPVYKYHYNNLKAKGWSEKKSHEEALLRFEEAVSQTQQSAESPDLSLIQQGSSMEKLFTMFITSPMSYYREGAAGIRNAKGNKADAVKRVAMFWMVAPALFQAIASAPLAFGDDEDKEDFAKGVAKAVVLGPVQGLFLARTAADFLYDELANERSWGDPQYSPMTQPIKSVGTILNEAGKLADGDADIDDLREAAIDLAGYLSGQPFPAGQNLIEGWASDDSTIWDKAGWGKTVTGRGKNKKSNKGAY